MSLGLIIKLALLAAGVLTVAGVVLVRLTGLWRRRKPAAWYAAAGQAGPKTIRLEVLPRSHWIPSGSVAGKVQAFRDLGFRVIGQYRIPELPQVRLVALAHPVDRIECVVYEHAAAGVFCKLVVHYRNASTLTVSTAPEPPTGERPGHETILLPRKTPPKKLCQTLYENLVVENLVPVHPKNFVSLFEKTYADQAAWRREQAGLQEAVLRDPELDALSTPLFQRLRDKDLDGVKEFLALGFSPEGRDSRGRTALMVAVETGDPAFVEAVLGAGADPNARAPGVPGIPPGDALVMTADMGEDTASRYLHGHGKGADAVAPDTVALVTPLTTAIETGVPEVLKALLNAGANLEGPGDPPLHFAAQEGDLDMVRSLVEAGAEVDLRDEDTLTPLHFAAMYGHAEVVEYLVSAGADVNARFGKRTAMTFAAENGAAEVVELLELYAKPRQARQARKLLDDAVPLGNVRARRLAVAATLGRSPMVRKLLVSGIHPDTLENDDDPEKATPLMLATQGGHVETMRALIEGGADVNAVDARGKPVVARGLDTRFMEEKSHQGEALRLLVRYSVDLSVLEEKDRLAVEGCLSA